MRKRAQQVIRRFEELVSTGDLPDRTKIRLLQQIPLVNWEADHLDPKSADDRLLGELLKYRESNPNESLLIISADLGFRLKSKQRSFNCVGPPSGIDFIHPVDERDKEIRRLRGELDAIKAASPELTLNFKNGEKVLRFGGLNDEPPTREDIFDKLEVISKLHKTTKEANAASLPLGNFGGSDEDWQKYEVEWDQYKVSYAEYVTERWQFEQRVFEIALRLSNISEVMAEHIDVFLYLPDGFDVVDKENYKEPSEPKPPQRPLNLYEKMAGLANLNLYPFVNIPTLQPPTPRLGRPSIRKTNSFEARYDFNNLKQGMYRDLDPLLVVFADDVRPFSFPIRFSLIIANARGLNEGELAVVFT